MNIWILTIGSSDVQLKTKAHWTKLFRDARSQLDNRGFSPPNEPIDDRFPIPARVMGVVYSQLQAEQYFNDLTCPLIDNFITEIENQSIVIDKMILVLSDQSIFSVGERNSQQHPYWQDTCTLQPILEKYLTQKLQQSSPYLQFQLLCLKPASTAEGLDDWNAVLKLIQYKFSLLNFPDDATIYVSHQAGTPAISSAVQFSSLSRFGKQVKFLVSNERDAKLTKVLPSSEYLKSIRKREAETLLERHDYSGIQALISEYIQEDSEIKILLEAAIQWNFAKFDNFADEIQKLSDPKFQNLVQQVQDRRQHWWWAAYEAAYLAVIRLEIQKDTVDALFHSFRAIEGIFTEWGIYNLRDHIKIENGRPYLKTTILDEERYFQRAKYKEKEGKRVPDNDIAKLKSHFEEIKTKNKEKPVFYGFIVYTLFREIRQEWKNKCKAINRFWDANNGISEKRNKIFHQLHGLTDSEFFEIWEVNSLDEWKVRIKEYANFVSGETFDSLDQESIDGTVASVMQNVHQALEKEIANLDRLILPSGKVQEIATAKSL